MTKNETINELLNTYKRVYVVDVYIENEIAGTHQWFAYASKKEAKNYIKLCKTYFRTRPEFKVRRTTFSYRDGNHTMKHTMVLNVYKRAA